MLSADQLSKKIEALADQRVSINDFEDWFRDESRNVHLWGDQSLNEFVDAVEVLFSERYFESLDDKSLRTQLQQEARRFARPFARYADAGSVVFCRPMVNPAIAVAAAALMTLIVPLPGGKIEMPAEVLHSGNAVGNPLTESSSAIRFVVLSAPPS